MARPLKKAPGMGCNTIYVFLVATKEPACHLYQIADMTRRSAIDVQHSYNTPPNGNGLR